MTEERIVPVKSWLRPSTYRALHRHAMRTSAGDVGELLARIAEQLVRPAAPAKRPRAAKHSAEELAQRRLDRRAAFFADSADPRHGTQNGYTNLGCRCERCREAAATYGAARRTR